MNVLLFKEDYSGKVVRNGREQGDIRSGQAVGRLLQQSRWVSKSSFLGMMVVRQKMVGVHGRENAEEELAGWTWWLANGMWR